MTLLCSATHPTPCCSSLLLFTLTMPSMFTSHRFSHSSLFPPISYHARAYPLLLLLLFHHLIIYTARTPSRQLSINVGIDTERGEDEVKDIELGGLDKHNETSVGSHPFLTTIINPNSTFMVLLGNSLPPSSPSLPSFILPLLSSLFSPLYSLPPILSSSHFHIF